MITSFEKFLAKFEQSFKGKQSIIYDVLANVFSMRIIGKKKTFPIYKFYNGKGEYIFEIRYGDVKANALQRGMWTHTENAKSYFKELLSGPYAVNELLINLISKILVSSKEKHEEILKLFPKSNSVI